MTGDLNLSSNINSNSSYQLAGLTWLPKIKDSEVGPTGNDMGYDANQGADCSNYQYSTSNCKANNQEPLGNQCLYNHKLFDNCGCNTAKFPISQNECSYSGSVRSQAWLLGDNVCKDQRYSNRMYGKKCLCTSVNFPHTSTATCPSPQTLLDDASKCSYQGVTRYERCKCDTAAGKYEFSSDKGEGYLCSKCTDDYGTHYKCEVVDCPTGQETGHKNNDSCNNGNGTWKETTNKSGSQQCYRCEDISNCDFYKNANGNITVPDTACSWRVYGNYTTTTLPANKSYSDSWVNMWGNSTVNGAFTTNKLAVGGACSSSGYCQTVLSATLNKAKATALARLPNLSITPLPVTAFSPALPAAVNTNAATKSTTVPNTTLTVPSVLSVIRLTFSPVENVSRLTIVPQQTALTLVPSVTPDIRSKTENVSSVVVQLTVKNVLPVRQRPAKPVTVAIT